MPDGPYRTREALSQKVKPRNATTGSGGEPPEVQHPASPAPRRGWLYGAVAAVAAVVVGATVLIPHGGSGTAGAGQFDFSILTDPQQVLDYVHQQHLPPATTQKLEEQAKKQELVVWHVTQYPGWNGQEGQAYTMDNGVDRYQFSVRPEGQSFGVLADKSTPAFSFSADADPPGSKMRGTWLTPAGSTRYDMQVGQTMTIRVR